MVIREANEADIPIIQQLAYPTWQESYRDILSEHQLAFMLNKIYSEAGLLEQMQSGVSYLIAELHEQPIGFAAFTFNAAQHITRIEKLYLLASQQGKGFGKQLIDYLKSVAIAQGSKHLELNVNRNNPTFQFYKKYGFEVFAEVNIPYYEYVLNDYVMRLGLD